MRSSLRAWLARAGADEHRGRGLDLACALACASMDSVRINTTANGKVVVMTRATTLAAHEE